MNITLACCWRPLLGAALLFGSPGAIAYETSEATHKACKGTGVQYDAGHKSYCCGTNDGCGTAMAKPAGASTAAKDAAKLAAK